MLNCLFVGIGGFIGAVLRYLIGLVSIKNPAGFPVNTFLINAFGALAIGISSVLIAIFCCFAFNLNFADFRILYFPEFILWLASIGILFKDVKQSAFSLLISIPVALSLEYTGLLGIIGIG